MTSSWKSVRRRSACSRNTFPGVTNRTRNARGVRAMAGDRKSTRLNSSHSQISYAVFCLKKILKLLEEPSADTFIVLTSSEPGALLPTIRSRVVSIHVAPLPAREMQEFLDHKVVAERLEDDDALPSDQEQRIAFAAGAPGRLLAGAEWGLALENAQ